MTELCKYCKDTHETMDKIKHCMDIRKGLVKGNLVMHGLNAEKLKDW